MTRRRGLPLLSFVVLLAAIVAVARRRSRSANATSATSATSAPAAPAPSPAPAPSVPPQPAAAWVAPIDGKCPASHPVKVNETSGIIHVPGGRFYDRTIPDRCYPTAEHAEADGYRRAKA